MNKDAQGQLVTGATVESVALYDQAVRAFSIGYGDVAGLFDAARQVAPDFVMAHLGKAWLLAFARDPAITPHAQPLLDLAQRQPMNERERAHFAALQHAVVGALGRSVAILDRHLMRYPRDLLAHQIAVFFDQFLGRSRWIRDRTARALLLWPNDVAGHDVLLTFHGFGLEETGEYARAEEESRRALDVEPNNSFAHHTVAHVMEMTGRPEDGVGWMLAREPFWAQPEHFLQGHLWWHNALCYLELGQYDRALALYDGPIMAVQRPLAAALTNSTALLWRLQALGRDVAGRWEALAEQWQEHADGRHSVFFDMHAAMAELGAGRERQVEQRLTAMRRTAAGGDEAATTYAEVGIPLVEGLAAFQRGRYDAAVDLLMAARFELWRIGGSHAQRDVVDWTLTEAAVRGGLRDVALALTNERLNGRPRSAVNRYFLQRALQIAA
jgi:tetratricopeptide (TPR) repeat protein